MSCCARCGQGICSTAGKVALNKVWHKCCFSCYNCCRPLQIESAKIYYGEVFCRSCCPEEVYPLKACRVNSTPSCNPECVKEVCYTSSDSDCCRPRDVHSCSCIPACCTPPPVCNCRVQCTPKPATYPRRQQQVCCCPKCRPKSPTICPSPWKKSCNYRKTYVCAPPCRQPPCKPPCSHCHIDRCKRCGEKVFAAEKVLTSNGAYHLGCFSCYCCCKSLCMKSLHEACGEIYCKRCYNNNFGVGGYGYCC